MRGGGGYFSVGLIGRYYSNSNIYENDIRVNVNNFSIVVQRPGSSLRTITTEYIEN